MFINVSTNNQIEIVASLAKEIWTEHYTPIIGKAQVDYMLERFQSEQAIAEQIRDGYRYFIVQESNHPIGYMSILLKENELVLNKIYVKFSKRGMGYGRKMVQFIEKIAKENALKKIVLTVNKNNAGSIKAYEKIGFRNVSSLIQDIGNGFVMDDYVMEKTVPAVE